MGTLKRFFFFFFKSATSDSVPEFRNIVRFGSYYYIALPMAAP